MNRVTMTLALGLMLSWLLPTAWAASATVQDEDAQERHLDIAEIKAQRAAAENDATLDEGLRASLIETYDAAIGSLQAAAAHAAQVVKFESEHSGIERMVASLRAELKKAMPPPRCVLPEGASADLAEMTLARERSRLAAHLASLRDAEQLAAERDASRKESFSRLGALDQKIDAVSDDLRADADRAADPQLKQAVRDRLLAQRLAIQREREALRAELTLLDARGELIPLQIDLAQRRIESAELVVARLQRTSAQLRHEEAERLLQSVRDECDAIGTEFEILAKTAAETERMAELLLGADGVEVDSEKAADALVVLRKNLSDLERMRQLTLRKFEAVGYEASAYRWWPEIPDDFPRQAEVAARLRRIEHLIPSVQHHLIQFRQQRTKERELREQTMLELRLQLTGEDGPDRIPRARELFETRRDVLDQLNRRYDRYSQQLIELRSLERDLLEKVDRFQSFLFERVLWVRSVPRPIIPRPGDIIDAFIWFASPARWKETFGVLARAMWGSPGSTFGMIALLILLLASRRSMRRRLTRLADKVDRPDRDLLRVSIEAVLHTILLAAPLPLALYFLSLVAKDADTGRVPFAGDNGLYFLSLIAGFLELSRQITAPDGLARIHFSWPPRSAERLHRVLGWSGVVVLPLLFVTLHLSTIGFAVSSPVEI